MEAINEGDVKSANLSRAMAFALSFALEDDDADS